MNHDEALKQVEELEERYEKHINEFNYFRGQKLFKSAKIIENCLFELYKEAKALKEEIEKGCRAKEPFRPFRYCGYIFQSKIIHCSDCQNLINRLNKIIGEEDGNKNTK